MRFQMYYNKYIISEAIKLNSVEDVISAIKTNSAGVRVNPKFKQETQEDYGKRRTSEHRLFECAECDR